MPTTRLEAFSDGVFAVAITLLVLNLDVPTPTHGVSLWHQLIDAKAWPHYPAYIVSFLTIGIIWINHHVMLDRLRSCDHTIMTLNLLLLMTIVVLPFTTNLGATFVRAGTGGAGLATALYAGSFLLMSIAFGALNRHILLDKAHLLKHEVDLETRRRIFRRAATGLLPYAAATAIAPFVPAAALVICGALAVFYATPLASSR
jgi:uncharacterized membrane protein